MASGKPSTRFPLEWHVQKGSWSSSMQPWVVSGGLVSISVRILWIFKIFRIFCKNIQHFRKFRTDRTRLSSRLSNFSLANSRALMYRRNENSGFPCISHRWIFAASRFFHRNLRIGARPENRQLTITVSLCMASGKPSTRFSLEWQVQKGFALSNNPLWNCGIDSEAEFPGGPGLIPVQFLRSFEIFRFFVKIFNIFEFLEPIERVSGQVCSISH